ncbi:MAG: alpha/beta hydrolase [Caldilineaceae bacterium]|nr:alpha/beta hydrolase [Caldilineaceae bacterium]
MPEFRTETGQIYYELRKGPSEDAPTLTLLHNFMSNGRSAWGPLLPALAEHFRLLVPDLPGHSRSHGYPPSFHHRTMAQQLAALMHAEGAAQGRLAGCSSGGMVAQLMVHHQWVAPASLTLISTTYSTNPATTGNTLVITPENFKASPGWMEATARLHDPYHYPGYYQEVLLPGFQALNGDSAIDLQLDDLQAWMLPVCIIHGEKDEFFPPFIVEAMAQALPQAELHLVAEQTHALLFRQPTPVRTLMLDFLMRHSP